MQVTKVNQCWGGDITYVATNEGWLYLAVVIDLYTVHRRTSRHFQFKYF
jgi:transposase InsO family protein